MLFPEAMMPGSFCLIPQRVISSVGNAPPAPVCPPKGCIGLSGGLCKHAAQFPTLPRPVSQTCFLHHGYTFLQAWASVWESLCLRSQLAAQPAAHSSRQSLSHQPSLMLLEPTAALRGYFASAGGLTSSFPAWVYCLLTQFQVTSMLEGTGVSISKKGSNFPPSWLPSVEFLGVGVSFPFLEHLMKLTRFRHPIKPYLISQSYFVKELLELRGFYFVLIFRS